MNISCNWLLHAVCTFFAKEKIGKRERNLVIAKQESNSALNTGASRGENACIYIFVYRFTIKSYFCSLTECFRRQSIIRILLVLFAFIYFAIACESILYCAAEIANDKNARGKKTYNSFGRLVVQLKKSVKELKQYEDAKGFADLPPIKRAELKRLY